MSFFAQVPQSPGARLAEQLGLNIGQGIARNFPTPEQMVQRQMTQQALGSLDNLSPNASPFDVVKSLISSTAAIPGSERYVGQLADLLLRRNAAENIYGGGTGQPAPVSQQPSVQPQVSPQTQFAPQQPSSLPQYNIPQSGTPQPQQYQTGGVLPRVIPAEEIESEARKASVVTGDPNRYQSRLGELASYNQLAEQAQQKARERALSFVGEDELGEFMKLGQRYGYLNNLDEWARATQKDWKSYKSNKEKLQNAFIPGFWRGLVTSKNDRDKTLKRLDPLVEKNIQMGFEPETREFLASKGLSPTEVEERIHPLTQSLERKLDSLTSVPVREIPGVRKTLESPGFVPGQNWESIPAKMRNQIENDLSKFFKDNVDENTALSVLRHKLWSEKNYPWQIVGPAIRKAQSQGLKLTPAQETEMTEVETQPPRQALSEIFLDWWRPIEFIKGAK